MVNFPRLWEASLASQSLGKFTIVTRNAPRQLLVVGLGAGAVAYIMEIIPWLRLEIISLYMPMCMHPKTEEGVLPLVLFNLASALGASSDNKK